MNSSETKYLLNAFQKMLSQHPELCPHDYKIYDSNYKTRLHKYECKVCGDRMAKPMSKDEVEPIKERRGVKHGKNNSK